MMTKLTITRLFFLSMMMFFSTIVLAKPAPFGVTMGSKVDTAAKTHSLKFVGVNEYSDGDMFAVDVTKMNFDGLKNLQLIYDREDKLIAAIAVLNKSRFNALFANLKRKYPLIKKKIPYVGSRSATFKKQGVLIKLNAPHLSFDMTLEYIDQQFMKKIKLIDKKKRIQKNKKEASML